MQVRRYFSIASSPDDAGDDLVPATARWFRVTEGLNDMGYIPNSPRSHRDHLPDWICTVKDCRKRWGDAQGGQFWYARCGRAESPQMRYRIELLFQKTHQKPIGPRRAIGFAFARRLLAEKLGFAVKWAAFAEIQCGRGGKRFMSFTELRSLCNNGEAKWPRNGVREVDNSILTGAPDDWQVNRNPRTTLLWRPTQGFDLRLSLETPPEKTISTPLYGRQNAARGKSIQSPSTTKYPKFLSIHSSLRRSKQTSVSGSANALLGNCRKYGFRG